MKILQISNYFAPHIGGIEQTTQDLTKAWPEHEHRVLCFNHEKGTITAMVNGVNVTRVNCQAKLASQSIALRYGTVLRNVLREFQPDVVIFHHPNPFVAHFLLPQLRKRSFKFVVWYHLDITKQKILRLFFNRQTRKLLQAADRVVATSPNYLTGSKFLTAVKEKCVVIPNAIDLDRFTLTENVQQLTEQIQQANQGKILCFAVGRHVPYKGLAYLVRASRLLPDNYRIVIGGVGPLTKQLQRMAAGDDKITFPGRLSNDELQAYYRACDIFCFPSITKNEAFGLSLAEAMSFGKPVVTFTIPGSGVNYVNIANETGLEVPNCDIDALAQAITTLANDDARRKKLGDQAKQRVLTNFTLKQLNENAQQLLKTICMENKDVKNCD